MLDEFQVVLHSADSIAAVGVLHPLAFHLENKAGSVSLSGGEKGLVFEVQGDCVCPERCEATCQSVAEVTDAVAATDNGLHIFRTKKDNTFSICCWLQAPQNSSAGKHNYDDTCT